MHSRLRERTEKTRPGALAGTRNDCDHIGSLESKLGSDLDVAGRIGEVAVRVGDGAKHGFTVRGRGVKHQSAPGDGDSQIVDVPAVFVDQSHFAFAFTTETLTHRENPASRLLAIRSKLETVFEACVEGQRNGAQIPRRGGSFPFQAREAWTFPSTPSASLA